MTSTEKNAPCPFCGGRVDPEGWLRGDGVRGPECESCGATAPTLAVWNSAQLAELEALHGGELGLPKEGWPEYHKRKMETLRELTVGHYERKLAERDALLRDLEGKTILSWADKRRISAALSASAEPSEREKQALQDEKRLGIERLPAEPSSPVDPDEFKIISMGSNDSGGQPYKLTVVSDSITEGRELLGKGLGRIIEQQVMAEIERDERADFEAAWSQRLAELKIKHRGNEFYRVQPNDLYRWHNVQDAWEMWQARAALERKP